MKAWVVWFGVLAAATAALLAVRANVNEAHVSLVFLLVVLGGSAQRGRALGVTLAVTAFLLFDVGFLPPYGGLAIARPYDWFVLAAFLVVSVVAAQLFERARAQAATAHQLAVKDAVVAAMSHDLRTPLTTIKAMAHDLAELGDERAVLIEEEADRLTALVTDMLDLSRIDRGAAALRPEPNEAEDLLGAALQRVSGRAGGREIRVTLDHGEPLLFGRFDFAQTLRVLVNLIENAIKYSPADEPVDVGVRRDAEWLVFSVADRGPGVPEGERTRIFDAFYRPPGVAPDTAGAGLGLAIAKALAEAQHGDIRYSARDGGGSVFALRVRAVDIKEVAAG